MKLTAISIWFHGVRHTTFAMLPVDADGKVRAPESLISSITAKIGVQRGDTISIS